MADADKPTRRPGPKWESDAREHVKNGLRKYLKPLTDLAARDANEGDTRLLVTDILCDLLGYDKYSELATEYMVRGEFADYAIRVGGTILAMVEVKRIATTLTVKHLRQVEQYGVNEGVEWLVLTNGAVWQVYRLIPGMPVSVDLVTEVDLLGAETAPKKAEKLVHLHKEFLRRGTLAELWEEAAATAPERLVEVLLSEAVLTEARRELRRQTGRAVDAADLGRAIRDTVLRPELAK
ncbi:MAG: type I restriction enzyme HsdR N-terminal domain-containing protein [Propionibacteriaceae bacterium]|jgi:predicted type IV restriction endonuclease|nr:type I restriction enzyme HsdR N-terminal domain-containing protein [Propionibacteriaceae bacterium]